jgi:hypothetical protein
MKRIVLGVAGGVGISVLLISFIEGFVHKLPIKSALLGVLVAYVVSSFCGGAVATLIDKSGKYLPAFIVAGLLMLAGIANFIALPHPVWFMVVSSLCYPLFCVAGAWVAMRFLKSKQ